MESTAVLDAEQLLDRITEISKQIPEPLPASTDNPSLASLGGPSRPLVIVLLQEIRVRRALVRTGKLVPTEMRTNMSRASVTMFRIATRYFSTMNADLRQCMPVIDCSEHYL